MNKADKINLFNEWVFDTDNALDLFFKSLPAETADKLDYSVASLDLIEDILLKRYMDFDETKDAKEMHWIDRASRYVGETFRKNIGGHWDIILEDEKNIFYNIPVITGYKEKATPYCPLVLCTASTDRRTGSFISSILKRAIEKKKKAID